MESHRPRPRRPSAGSYFRRSVTRGDMEDVFVRRSARRETKEELYARVRGTFQRGQREMLGPGKTETETKKKRDATN